MHQERLESLGDKQHGFIQRRSCQTYSIAFLWSNYKVDERNSVDVIYLDFAKSFALDLMKTLLIFLIKIRLTIYTDT